MKPFRNLKLYTRPRIWTITGLISLTVLCVNILWHNICSICTEVQKSKLLLHVIWFRLLVGFGFCDVPDGHLNASSCLRLYGPPLMACLHEDPLLRSSMEVLKMWFSPRIECKHAEVVMVTELARVEPFSKRWMALCRPRPTSPIGCWVGRWAGGL